MGGLDRDRLASLEPLFRPQSIAVVGASSDPLKIGGLPVDFLKTYRFAGPIYPVNPKADVIQGLKAYKSIGEVGAPVDQAIVAVPEPAVLATIEACAKAGVRSLVVFSAGFAEIGEAGKAGQARLKQIARDANIRVLGPNCIGAVNFATGMVSSFHPSFRTGCDKLGRIGLVTQSGAFGGLCFVLARERNMAFSLVITTGNEVDVDAADGIAFLAEDPGTDVILTYLEGFRDGPKLLAALELARKNRKPVVAMKLGRTQAGAQAGASHTGSLAGADEVYDAVFRQYGVWRADTIEDFLDVAYGVAIGNLPANRRVGIVTVSGGVGILMADHAVGAGLEVAKLPEAAQKRVLEMVPFAGAGNPVDVTGQVVNDYGLITRALDMVLETGVYASVVNYVGSAPRNPNLVGLLRDGMTGTRKKHPDALVVIGGPSSDAFRAEMDALGFLSYDDPSRAVRAIGALAWLAEQRDRKPPEIAAPVRAAKLPDGPLSEREALAALAAAGVPVVETRLAATADAAVAAAKALGFPVVVKLASPDVLHKTEVGGVALGLASEDAVRQAFADIVARAKKAVPGAKIDGCLVAPMVSGGLECVLGIHRDPVFGPVVMFGLGGVFVEALRDVTFRVAPIDLREARRMIGEIRAAKVLDGVRGKPPADREALAHALVRLSEFAVAHADVLEGVDVNPFLVRADGQGALALDAAFVRQTQ